jgi:hypothetical protein
MISKGSKVFFGRPNGEQTQGEVVKVNRTTFKVRTLEERGNGRGAGSGAIWKVHKSLCKEVTPQGGPSPQTPSRGFVVPGQTYTVPAEDALVANALGKLTGPERAAIAAHFRRGHISGDRF